MVLMSSARKQPMGIPALMALSTGCMVGESVTSGTLGTSAEGSGHQAPWGFLSLVWSLSRSDKSHAH